MTYCPARETRARIINQRLILLALATALFAVATTFLPEDGAAAQSAGAHLAAGAESYSFRSAPAVSFSEVR